MHTPSLSRVLKNSSIKKWNLVESWFICWFFQIFYTLFQMQSKSVVGVSILKKSPYVSTFEVACLSCVIIQQNFFASQLKIYKVELYEGSP